MLTTNNPSCVHESLDPAQASLDRICLAKLLLDVSIGSNDRWVMLAVVLLAESLFHDPIQRQLVQACREIDEKEQTEQCGNGGAWRPLAAVRPGFRLAVHGLVSGGDSTSAGTAQNHVLLNVARLLWQSSWPEYVTSLG